MKPWSSSAATQPFASRPTAPQSPPSFYGISRGIARFGLLISTTMTLTFLARLIPPFTVVYWIAIATTFLALLGYAALCSSQHRPIVLMVVICLLFGVTLGGWDAIAGLLADDSGKALSLQLVLLIAVFGISSAIAHVFFRPQVKPNPLPPTDAEGPPIWTDDISASSWLED